MDTYNKNWPQVHDNFYVLKPIVLVKGTTVVGHAMSTISKYEEEIERLRRKIRELESNREEDDDSWGEDEKEELETIVRKIPTKRKSVKKNVCQEEDESDEFFKALHERTTDVRRNKRKRK